MWEKLQPWVFSKKQPKEYAHHTLGSIIKEKSEELWGKEVKISVLLLKKGRIIVPAIGRQIITIYIKREILTVNMVCVY